MSLGGLRKGGWLFLKLCGDGPSVTDFKSQAAWAGGVGKIDGKGQKTQVVGLVAAVFPFPPSQDPFKGLDVAAACFFFPRGRPVFLRENSDLG